MVVLLAIQNIPDCITYTSYANMSGIIHNNEKKDKYLLNLQITNCTLKSLNVSLSEMQSPFLNINVCDIYLSRLFLISI